MTKMNKIAAGLAASLLLVSAGQVAAETVQTTATATVQNAFELTSDADLDFGTFRATNDDSGVVVAKLERPANPAESSVSTNGTGDDAIIQSLVEGSPAEYSISGVARFSTLTIEVPDDASVVLEAPGAATTDAKFAVKSFTAYKTSGTPGDIPIDGSFQGTIQADTDGNATFTVGATLETDDTTLAYSDIAYSGTYEIKVNY
ncbi:DUF4402 domain-containing protein [Paraglaciecola agarilytica]|uniref:DUF4402 domain-containing protein n=1 Tax=Paraglaciecola chathamensis TaxID=368405 RepID=UPI001C089DE9|nr:DUF4402 domain-containing protein [Paraglaciecola agarilytica]MBU3016728.1 DUF4402 domain-containing protein [Paraglaciecola agarilytica]